jgi:hypothetical protein
LIERAYLVSVFLFVRAGDLVNACKISAEIGREGVEKKKGKSIISLCLPFAMFPCVVPSTAALSKKEKKRKEKKRKRDQSPLTALPQKQRTTTATSAGPASG